MDNRILGLVIYITAIMIGILCKKNKFIFLTLCIYVFLLFATNYDSPDYVSYESIYNNVDSLWSLTTESGFRFICKFFNILGFSFKEFRLFWGLLYVGLVYNYVRRCSELPTLVIAFLLICPMALDISGIRSSVAYLIVMNFTLFLEKANVKRRCFYIVGVLTAATIHITSLFYLIFALKRNRTYRKDLIMIFIFILGSAILVYTPLLDVLVRMTGNAKLMKWFSSESIYTYPNFNGFISVAFFVVSQYLLSRWAFYIACKEKPIKNKKVCFSSIVTQYNLSKMMLLLLPLNMVAIESQRLLFGFFIIFYSLVSNVLITYNGMCYRKEKFYLFMTTVVFSILCMQMYMYSYSSHDVVGTLSKNLLFNM